RLRWSFRLAVVPRSSADHQLTTLQALFMESDTLEEIVASARAQAAGRPAGLEWRYRMVCLIVIALVVLGVLVFLANHYRYRALTIAARIAPPTRNGPKLIALCSVIRLAASRARLTMADNTKASAAPVISAGQPSQPSTSPVRPASLTSPPPS